MVNLSFDNVRCVDGHLAWPSLADNSGSLLGVGLTVLLLGFLVVRLPPAWPNWFLVHGVGIDIGMLESLIKVHRNGCYHDRDLHFLQQSCWFCPGLGLKLLKQIYFNLVWEPDYIGTIRVSLNAPANLGNVRAGGVMMAWLRDLKWNPTSCSSLVSHCCW